MEVGGWSGQMISGWALDAFDVVVFPGGNAKRQAEALGVEGRTAVRAFVRSGGGFVGICAGAYLATSQFKWSSGLIKVQSVSGSFEVPELGRRLMEDRGVGDVTIEFTRAGELLFGQQRRREIRYSGGPVFLRGELEAADGCAVLATFASEMVQYEPQRNTMIGKPAMIASKYGEGLVIAISPHPELSDGTDFILRQAVLAAGGRPSRVIRKNAQKAMP